MAKTVNFFLGTTIKFTKFNVNHVIFWSNIFTEYVCRCKVWAKFNVWLTHVGQDSYAWGSEMLKSMNA